MPDAGQPERQNRLGVVSQRLEELSAVPTKVEYAEEFVALFQEKRRLEASLRAASESRFSNQAMQNLRQSSLAGTDSDNVLANVNRELRKLEKRDTELWLIASITGI